MRFPVYSYEIICGKVARAASRKGIGRLPTLWSGAGIQDSYRLDRRT